MSDVYWRCANPQKVGVLCKYEGKYMIVEYSEVSDQVRSARECEMEDGSLGRLVYDAGNICNHYFTMNFLRRVCNEYAVCASAGACLATGEHAGAVIAMALRARVS
jgi:UDP-N-acetylglucosamine pyrophosphorylase